MTIAAADLAGRAVFVAGLGKGSGKTSFVNYALGLLRAAGSRTAVLGIGLDGDGSARGSSRAAVPIEPGELFVTAEQFLSASGCEPVIHALVGGSTPFGRLVLARARRRGKAVLVGPESNAEAAQAIRVAREELGAESVLVDGAFDRITQIASIEGGRSYLAATIARGELGQRAAAMRRLSMLAGLPLVEAELPESACAVKGPLTAQTLARLPRDCELIAIEDLTKAFLSLEELVTLTRTRTLAVRRMLDFGGFVVRLLDLSRAELEDALGDEAAIARVAYNPYEACVDAA
jgi:hypothetical protein